MRPAPRRSFVSFNTQANPLAAYLLAIEAAVRDETESAMEQGARLQAEMRADLAKLTTEVERLRSELRGDSRHRRYREFFKFIFFEKILMEVCSIFHQILKVLNIFITKLHGISENVSQILTDRVRGLATLVNTF